MREGGRAGLLLGSVHIWLLGTGWCVALLVDNNLSLRIPENRPKPQPPSRLLPPGAPPLGAGCGAVCFPRELAFELEAGAHAPSLPLFCPWP